MARNSNKETPATDATAKIGDVVVCFAAELAPTKAALAARLPKGATVSTVVKGTKATLTVVAA